METEGRKTKEELSLLTADDFSDSIAEMGQLGGGDGGQPSPDATAGGMQALAIAR